MGESQDGETTFGIAKGLRFDLKGTGSPKEVTNVGKAGNFAWRVESEVKQDDCSDLFTSFFLMLVNL